VQSLQKFQYFQILLKDCAALPLAFHTSAAWPKGQSGVKHYFGILKLHSIFLTKWHSFGINIEMKLN
jgi:hypothetical protein